MSGIRFIDGFIPLVIDPDAGRIAAVLPEPGVEFLLYGGLATGLGSSALPLDRGGPGELQIVRVVRRGPARHLEALARDLGVGGSPLPGGARESAERRAVADAFGRSLLAVLPVVPAVERARWGDVVPAHHRDAEWVDVTSLAASDVFNIAGTVSFGLRSMGGPLPDATVYSADGAHSTADPVAARSGEAGTVIGGSLVFTTVARPPRALGAVLPDARTFTVDQRIVLRPFPTGFRPHAFHPRSGSFGKRRVDPSQIADDRALTVLQPAFRTDRPIVFAVDPGIPAPFRDAVVAGAGWWGDAFAAAGLPDAYRVEVRDAAVDPWSIDVNPVWWVHRAERGWSMGHAVSDPATGEILRGSVRLGSQRIAQLRALFEALLAPYGAADEADRLAEIDDALQARIRHLAAHEVGHALGFVHNYASTTHRTPSVMDYPHPLVSLDAHGRPSLRDAYSTGVGEWDRYIVAHAYGAEAGRDALRDATNLPFLTDADGHAPGASTAVAVPWTLPLGAELPDAFAALERIIAVRGAALAGFGPAVAPPEADAGELENRFGLLHLLHRFETARVARLIGGAEYGYAHVGDGSAADARPAPIAAGIQQRAVAALARLVVPDVVRVPDAAAAFFAPPSIRYVRGTATISSARLGPLADLDLYEAAAAALVGAEAFGVERLNRLAATSAYDPVAPTISTLAQALFGAATSPVAHETLRLHLAHALAGRRLTLAAREHAAVALRDAAEGEASRAPWVEFALAGDASRLPPLPIVPPGAPL